MASSLHMAIGPARTLLLLPTGSQLPTGIHLVWGPPWAAGGSLPQGSEHLSPLLLHWPECLQSCCSHIFSLLLLAAQFLFPLLTYMILEVLSLLLMNLALTSGGSIFELADAGFSRCREIFWQLLKEATHVAPLLPKPGRANWIHLLFEKDENVWQMVCSY